MTVPECSFPNLRELLLRAVPHTLQRARLVIAVSEHTRRDLVTLLGVPPGIIRVAGNAADPVFRPIDDPAWRAAERRRLGLPERFVLTVGTLEPRKNLVRLLEALALLRDRGPRTGGAGEIPLIVAGREGWLYEPIYERVEQLRLRSQVRFLGDVSDRDLLALYNLASVMVFPSLYEGFGVPPLEALACGAVVVCSHTSSLPDVVGEAALLVDPYDGAALAEAIERALGDDNLRRDLAARGPAQARRYTWDAAARSVHAALREAAGCHHPSSARGGQSAGRTQSDLSHTQQGGGLSGVCNTPLHSGDATLHGGDATLHGGDATLHGGDALPHSASRGPLR